MIYTARFKKLTTAVLDFVPDDDGFYYLRMVGFEIVVNAIWARLSARDSRGPAYSSGVSLCSGDGYEKGASAGKGVRYRTIRSRLPGGMVDLAMIHPLLTVSEDSLAGFHLLSYDEDIPRGFFHRLNRSLAVPLLPEWEIWLWSAGQELQSFKSLKKDYTWNAGERVETEVLTEVDLTPIQSKDGLGEVRCYQVVCCGKYREAWLKIIREQLGLRVLLDRHDQWHFSSGPWTVYYEDDLWQVARGGEPLAVGASLDLALVRAREKLGVPMVIGG